MCSMSMGKSAARMCEPQLSFDDMQGIVDAAIAGFGLAWLPSWLLARYEATGQLVTRDGELLPTFAGDPRCVAEEPVSRVEDALRD